MLPLCRKDCVAVLQIVRERLVQIDLLASRERLLRGLAMLVRVRRDHHQLDARIGQAGVEVLVDADLEWVAGSPVLLLEEGSGLRRPRRKDLAESDDLQAELLEVLRQEPPQVPHSAEPCSNDGDPDLSPVLSRHAALAFQVLQTQMGELQAHWSFF